MDAMTRREAIAKAGTAATLLSLPSVLLACGSGGSTATKGVGGRGTNARIGSLTWALAGSPPTLDPATGSSATGYQVMNLGLEGLVSIDNDLQVAPRLAESWAQTDPLHYVYQLRPGVKFWDGTPLTAEDVVYSMSRHLDPKVASQIATHYARVKSIKATGPAEITVVLSEPDPLFKYVPARSFVTPKAFTERLGKKLGVSGARVNTMGTGPYRITKFDSETGATLVRNPLYWGKPATAENVNFEVIADPSDLLLALESGDVDGAAAVPLDLLRDLRGMRGVAVSTPPGLTPYFLSFDVTRPPFNDVHVRRAVAHATDTAGMVKAFLNGAGEPAKAIPAPQQWAGLASPARVEEIYSQIPQYPFDLEAAKRELAQSQHPGGFTVTTQYTSGDKSLGKALVSLSETLKGIGIRLQVKEVPETKWLADYYAHNQALLGIGYAPSAPDPTNFLQLFYPSANARKNSVNTANFKDERVDRLLREQARTTDKERRAELIAEVLRIAGEELPYLPLWWQSLPLALNTKYLYNGFAEIFYFQNWVANVRVRA